MDEGWNEWDVVNWGMGFPSISDLVLAAAMSDGEARR